MVFCSLRFSGTATDEFCDHFFDSFNILSNNSNMICYKSASNIERWWPDSLIYT